MPAPFLRASCFWLLTGAADCWKCSQSTQVSAIALAGYDELADDAEWEWVDGRSLLSYISGVDPVSLRAIQDVAPEPSEPLHYSRVHMAKLLPLLCR